MLEAEQVPPWSAGGPVVQEECDETIMANLLSGKYSGRIPQAGHGEFYAGLSGLAVVAACFDLNHNRWMETGRIACHLVFRS